MKKHRQGPDMVAHTTAASLKRMSLSLASSTKQVHNQRRLQKSISGKTRYM